jgi:signal transduction histidine kinase
VLFTSAGVPPLGVQRDAAVYRVAQEALHNALRHSGAAEVHVSLCPGPRRVTLDVTDDGGGFVTGAASGGLGLASMRERAAAVGASLTIRSAPGQGTSIRLAVPLHRGRA